MTDTSQTAALALNDDKLNQKLKAVIRSRSGLIGAIIIAFLLVLCLMAIFKLSPYDPIAQNPPARLKPPNEAYLFGTDQFGRDVFTRIVFGVANSSLIAVVAVFFATVIGTLCGLTSGFFRGVSDGLITGVTNVLFAFPPLLLALSLASIFDRNWLTIAVAIAIVYIPIFIRVTRGPVLSLREIEYVKAATSIGQSRIAIMFRHILPNIIPIIIVQVTLSLSWAVLTEASLSFLGLGTPPPAPSLGSMIFEARTLVNIAPWTMIAPGIFVVLLVVGLNLLGDGLRDSLDPRTKGKKRQRNE